MKKHILIPALSVAGGAAALVLRLVQVRTGFEADTGLAISGNPAGMALAALLILLAAVFLALGWSLPRKSDKLTFPAAFPVPESTLLLPIVAGALLMALSGLADIAMGLGLLIGAMFPSTVHLLLGAASVAAAAGMVMGAAAGRRGSRDFNGTVLLIAPAMLVVRLVLTYRISSTDPTLAAYYVELLALVFLTLGFFRLSSFAFGDGRTRAFAVYCALAAVCSLGSLADWGSHVRCISSPLLYVGGAAVLLGFLVLRLKAPQPPQAAQPSEPAES